MEAAARKHGNTQIVVVDNGSTDGTGAYIKREHPDVIVVTTARQCIGAARNHGARCTDSTIIAFIDADCLMAEDHLINAEQVLSEGGISVTGSSYELPEQPGWIERTWHLLHRRAADGFTRLIPAGNLVVTREAFDAVGGFNERLVTGEDAELCQRLARFGCRPFASRGIRVAHLGNPKTLKGFYSRNVWHSLGMFGAARSSLLDRPTIMMFVHLLLTASALLAPFVFPLTIRGSLTALLASQIVVPLTTVAYRLVSKGAGITWRNAAPELTRALLLYWLYYWARVRALQLLISKRGQTYNKRM